MTADRYAGETKQNAEVTAKKQAACKSALPARKVKFTVDRHHRLCARLCATHTRAIARVIVCASRYFPVLPPPFLCPSRDAKSEGCKNSDGTEGKGPRARLEY